MARHASVTGSVLYEVEGPVATITLNRPDVGNALDIPMLREVMEFAIRCENDAAIRCVVLTGAGKLFCGGGDVAAFAAAGDDLPAFLREITAYLNSVVSIFARMDKPVVTAVNGSAAGAGIGLAILGDIVLAEPTASFSLAYTAIGLTPDGGATWLLPRLVGLRRAQELCLTNRKVRAEEAASIGLISRVVEAGTLKAETAKLAAELSRSATSALGATRKMLVESMSNTLDSQLSLEGRVISNQSRNPEGREGVTAFLEKRAPRFLKED
jgi:2-(1,2-epoxy-1,2-dihydrophenyl)acetyl-CoA isomerase